MMRKSTKIVATYGPSISPERTLTAVLAAGVDVIRLNMSHGDHASHAQAVRQVRSLAGRLDRPVGLLLDLRGPKIRIGQLPSEPRELLPGETIALVESQASVPEGAIPIEGYPHLAAAVQPGQAILLDDGAIELEALESREGTVVCRVVNGGPIRSRKGVNLPATELRSLTIPTQRDWRDLAFGIEQGVDWVALSFVRSAAEVHALRERLHALGGRASVIAKIEKREALSRLEEILAASDGIMVARGDLGVETELEEVVLRQKEIIAACNRAGKIVITATQMLESMIARPRPTRAEVADVSNAIFDGTDAVMLSGETAVGAHPVEAVSFMARIAEETERRLDPQRMLRLGPSMGAGAVGERDWIRTTPELPEPGVPDAVAHAACVTAQQIAADALVCLTRSGLTARLVSRYRPCCPILAVSPHSEIVHQLTLVWGVRPMLLDAELTGSDGVREALDALLEAGLLSAGNRVVITAGVSEGALKGKTNLVRVEEI